MKAEWIYALSGGLLIGLSVSLMLLWNGRVTGISGILYGLLTPKKNDISWRLSFVLGLVTGGFFLSMTTIVSAVQFPKDIHWTIPVAGLLVGFGTVLGSGCTSGHGVCGISRLSLRSILATVLFISAGILTVYVMRLGGFLS